MNTKNSISKTIIFSIMLLVSIGIASTLLTNHYVNTQGSKIYTDQDLICHWTINESVNANVTLYNGATLNTTQTNIACSANTGCSTSGAGIVPAQYTTKGEVWICSVRYAMGSVLDEQNFSFTIDDTVPTYPRIYFSNGTEISTNTTVSIPEDANSAFIINSTDADGDSIHYQVASNTISCTIQSSNGTITCAPTLESQIGIRELRFRSEDNTTGATRGYTNLSINVTPTNDPPFFSPTLSDKTKYEYQAVNYTITGADDESNTPYTFSLTSDLANLIIVNTSNTTARIQFNNSGQDNATYWDRGNHTINVTIGDSDPTNPRNSTFSFNLQIIPVNHLPVIALIANKTGIQGGSLLFTFNATDIDNDTLTFFTNDSYYTVTNLPNTHNSSGVTFGEARINITNLTNNHVIHRYISISVSDTKQNASQNVFINITNTNDAPIIYQNSTAAINTLNNSNIENLTAYINIPFVYQVNGTDVDIFTYANDSISYTSNNSNVSINTTTGIITKTFLSPASIPFIITLTDSHGATANKTGLITVLPNNNPYFTQEPLPALNCFEYDATNYPQNCTYNLSLYVNDSDLGDYVDRYYDNTTLFDINITTGIIQFSPLQDDIGTRQIRLNISDSRGGINNTILNLTISNTNNAPNLNTIPTGFGSGVYITVGQVFNYVVSASDLDLSAQGIVENLTFNASISGPNPNLFTINKTSNTTGQITFTPLVSDTGEYTTNISVSDRNNNMSIQTVTFRVYNVTTAPNITQITPSGTPLINGGVNTSWLNTSLFPGMQTGITINENESYTFNQNTTIDTQYANTAHYAWYINNALNSSSSAFPLTFGFFSNRQYNISLLVTDDFAKNASFYWNVSVTNINRAPVLRNNLTNLVVNGTTTYSNYFSYTNLSVRFIDPDDDLNSNNLIDGNETTTLSFDLADSNYSCQYANFTFTSTDLKVNAKGIGECLVTFKAADSENNLSVLGSNQVQINITAISEETTNDRIVYVSQGGGGTQTQIITIPIPQEIETPKPLSIISPQLINIYRNDTIRIPIILNNTWNDTLEGVTISAYTNATNVSFFFDKTYFPRLYQNKTEEIVLTVSNYKGDGHYELQIIGEITNPRYTDKTTIYINSAEMRTEAEELENKISFARDLLSSNPECMELSELLTQAKVELSKQNYKKGAKIVDDVVNGCKYLVSNTNKKVEEKPARDFIKRFDWQQKYTDYAIMGTFGLIFVMAAVYIFRKKSAEENI
ncbi:MAG: hypothetical protein WC916_07170 [Candidatus Woesearchaeota archaeon]